MEPGENGDLETFFGGTGTRFRIFIKIKIKFGEGKIAFSPPQNTKNTVISTTAPK
jgi:hypothetical protein